MHYNYQSYFIVILTRLLVLNFEINFDNKKIYYLNLFQSLE